MSTVSTKEFLKSVLPELKENESYVVASNYKPKVGKIQHKAKKVKTLDEIISEGVHIESTNKNTFYRLGSVRTDSPKIDAESVQKLKAFFLDIDVGKPSNSYKDKPTARKDIDDFINESKLPKPFIIDSGNGFHLYWALTEAISKEEWLSFTSDFSEWLKDSDLIIDPSVVAKPTQDLRLVGTRNFNTTEDIELRAKILEVGSVEPFDTYRNLIPKGVGKDVKFTGAVKGKLSKFQESLLNNFDHKFSIIKEKALKGEGCNQIKYGYEHPDKVSYGLWLDFISIAEFCTDKDWAVHDISKGYSNYNREEVNSKLGEMNSPHLCSTFAKNNPEGCENCPVKNTVNTPISTGKTVKAVDLNRKPKPKPATPIVREVVEKEIETPKVEIKTEKVKSTDLPPPIGNLVDVSMLEDEYPIPTEDEMPESFFMSGSAIYRKVLKTKDKKLVETDELVTNHIIYPIRRFYDKEDGFALLVKACLPHDGDILFNLPLEVISDQNKLRNNLAKNASITAVDGQAGHLRDYFSAWTQLLTTREEASETYKQLGWVDDDKLLIGERLYSAGKIVKVPVSKSSEKLFDKFKPRGSISAWSSAMNKIFNCEGAELHQLTIGFGIGSIMLKYAPSDMKGSLIHLASDGGGRNKTATLRAVASIWGDPHKCLSNGKDSLATIWNRRGQFNSLPMAIDEITKAKDGELPDLLLGLTSGEGPGRMQASVNQERDNLASWEGITISSSNRSVVSVLKSMKSRPEGEMTRILEFDLTTAKRTLSLTETQEQMEIIIQNSGVAGDLIAKYVVANLHAVKKFMYDMYDRISKNDGSIKFTAECRFWLWNVAMGLVGIKIGNVLNICNFDLKSVYKAGVIMLTKAKRQIDELTVDSMSKLHEFVMEHQNYLLITDSTVTYSKDGVQVEGDNVKPIPPRMGVTSLRYERDTDTLFVIKKVLNKWLIAEGLAEGSFYGGFDRVFEKVDEETGKSIKYKQALTKNVAITKGYSTDSPVYCFIVKHYKRYGGKLDEENEEQKN